MMKMKKFLAMLLAAAMLFSLAACNSTGDNDDGGNDNNTAAVGGNDGSFGGDESTLVNPDELPHYKIAFSYYSYADKLGGQFRDSIQYLCDAFNCEVVFFESGMGDEAVTNIESTLAAGDFDGIIYVGATPSVVAVAEKYQVPYVAACGFASLEEELNTLATYEYFLGGVVDDDVWAGTHCVEALYNAGCRNVTFSGMTQGFLKSHDDRADAFHAFAAAHDDFNVLGESYTMAETASDVSSFAASFPNMDGMCFSAGSDAIYLTMVSEGIADGSIKIAAVDISSQTGDYFENGVQVWTCGGQYATAMVAFAVLYNYMIDGTVILPSKTEPLTRQYIEVTSYEEYQEYVKYVENPIPTYTVDEIAQMIHYFNPDITYADYEKEAVTYSLTDIMARHGDLIS